MQHSVQYNCTILISKVYVGYYPTGAVLSEKDEDVIISNKAVLSAEAEEPHTPEKQKTSTLRKLMPNKKSKGGPSPKSAGYSLSINY